MTAVLATLLVLVLPAQPATAPDAVRVASAAFEYRDFEKVVELLDPWVHPPRISDEKLMVQARNLLGVSRHVLGDIPRAREEFAQLLLADPEHQLDAFKIPPQVIETFEQVRREMKAVLDPLIIQKRGRPKEEPPLGARVLVEAPSRWMMFLPLGAPQFALDQPVRGSIFATAQALGVALQAVSYVIGDGAVRTSDRYRTFERIFYAGLATAVAGYGASVILGNVDYEPYRRDLLAPPAQETPGAMTFSVTFPLSL